MKTETIETRPQVIQVLRLAKYLKITMISLFTKIGENTENFSRELESIKNKQREFVELLTNHYVQIICQMYATCFTHVILLNHLKDNVRYICFTCERDKGY